MPIKSLEPFQVTPSLLNEVNTLAAPEMLEAAIRAAQGELGSAAEAMTLLSYQAEFRQGAKQDEYVQTSIEPVEKLESADRSFQIRFGVGEENNGKVGNWQLHFCPRFAAKLLPYSVAQATADGRTDQVLWPRPEPSVASGEAIDDGKKLLWLAGQCARAYFKRLDEEWLASVNEKSLQDNPQARRYGGIAVSTTLTCMPQKDWVLRCVTDYQLPLERHKLGKIMHFQEMLVGESGEESYLLGTARFTVVRMSAAGAAVYPDGGKDKPS